MFKKNIPEERLLFAEYNPVYQNQRHSQTIDDILRERTAKRKKSLTFSDKVLRFLLVVLILVLGILGYMVADLFRGYEEAAAINNEIRQNSVIETSKKAVNSIDSNVNEKTSIDVDFDYLKKINSDVVAYIKIPGTKIDYPIVQTSDNEKYLNTSLIGNTTKSGSIFLDYRNSSSMTDRISIIYGHNMKDSSMFADINHYVDEKYYSEHKEVLIVDMDNVIHYYDIVSVLNILPDDVDVYDIENASCESIEDYTKRLVSIKKASCYETYNVFDFAKPTVVLSTCRANGSRRMCLVLQENIK